MSHYPECDCSRCYRKQLVHGLSRAHGELLRRIAKNPGTRHVGLPAFDKLGAAALERRGMIECDPAFGAMGKPYRPTDRGRAWLRQVAAIERACGEAAHA